VSLALLDIVLLILMIRFFVRSKKREHYQHPLAALEQPAQQTAQEPSPRVNTD
jgi:hypothetical protein